MLLLLLNTRTWHVSCSVYVDRDQNSAVRPIFNGIRIVNVSKKLTTGLLAVMTAGILSTTVHAAAITGSSANVDLIAAPADVSGGALESDTLFRVFEEKTTTVSGLAVQTASVGETLVTATGGSVSAAVTSFFVHFDRVGGQDAGSAGILDAFLEFDGDIVGIIWQAGDLVATDSLLGLAGTTYTPASIRGYEAADSLIFSSLNRVDFSALVDNAKVDSFRVLVADAIPEPGAIAIFGLGLAGLVYTRRKRTA